MIPAPHGALEAIYRPTTNAAQRVALVLHPHPLHGGTMHNKVVARAAKALQESGFTTMRVNFRGVGYSTGTHDEGRGEIEDARLALDYLLNDQPAAQEVILAGFSFGSVVAMRLGCVDSRVHKLILIGAPTRLFDSTELFACTKPQLFIHGVSDTIAPLAPIEELIAQLPSHEHLQFARITGAGHFFDDQLPELMRVIQAYVG